MSTTTKTGSRKRGPVGRSETNGHREIELTQSPLKGLKLKGTKELPPTYSYDGVRLQSLLEDEDPQAFVSLFKIVESVVGKEGSDLIRTELAKAKSDPGIELLVDVLNDIASAYGLTMGESSASA